MLIINLFLIGFGQFDYPDDDKKIKRTTGNTLTDGFYFTTAQFSTVGYGDITPRSAFAKWISGFFHITITAISLSLLFPINNSERTYDNIFSIPGTSTSA